VFSLAPQTDDDGVTFRSTYDGSAQRLTPELAVHIQERLGADMQMALDICCGLPAPDEEIRLAAKRTLAWAARARDAHVRPDQCLFGIIQGGVDMDLRAEQAAQMSALEFDGYGIGGLSVGEPRAEMLPALTAAVAELPADRPRYLMGVGDPVTLLDSIALGVDMFDCVLPTRLARHGTALTSLGRYQVRGARHAADDQPLDPTCACRVCARFSRGYVRHLLMVSEPSGGRLLTIHNLSWLLGLVDEARQAIRAGTLAAVRTRVAAIWEPGSLR
jgi:queuine tRNA-ribosyltransferase